jgi:rhodanese-related sulfurtransferase
MFRIINADQILEKMTSFLDATNGTPAADKLYLIEISSPQEFELCHLPKAISINESTIHSNISLFVQNRAAEIILYGNTNNYSALERIAYDLFVHGYSSIYIYKDGKVDWKSRGLWTESSIVPADNERKLGTTPKMPKKPETGIEPPFSKVA